MWDLAVREEDYGAADEMLRRLKAPPLSMRLFMTFVRDTAVRAALLEEARVSDTRQSQIAARYIATFLEDPEGAEELARYDLAPRRTPVIRANAQLLLAWLEVMRGRWESSSKAFQQAEAMQEGSVVLVQRAMAATLPFLAVPSADLDSIRTQVTRWDPGAEAADPSASLNARLGPHLRLYLLGLLSARQNDHAAAMRFAADIERAGAPAEAREVVRDLAQTVRADVALKSGRAEDGRRALDAIQGEVPLELVSAPVYANAREFTQEHARYLRIMALSASERQSDAIRWIETSFAGAPSEIAYLAPMHLKRAELHERQGEWSKATEHYRRFVALWRDCDIALRPGVESARARIRLLERKAG